MNLFVIDGFGIPALFIASLAAFGLTSIALSGKIVAHWMKHLTHSATPSEKHASIEELRRVKDPRALLILTDVAMDPEEDKHVRKTAAEAVRGMNAHYLGHGNKVPQLSAAVGRDDALGVIAALNVDFEDQGKTYAQSAFAIGRQYMRLGRYAEAREWFTRARLRDEKVMLYGSLTDRLIDICNHRLLEEGDALYAAGNYHGAREHYALLSHGLDHWKKRGFALFLRSACVYCKLQDYRDADEATLLALHFGQETDKSLALIGLLQKLPCRSVELENANEASEAVRKAIDKCVASMMDGLCCKRTDETTEVGGSDGAASCC